MMLFNSELEVHQGRVNVINYKDEKYWATKNLFSKIYISVVELTIKTYEAKILQQRWEMDVCIGSDVTILTFL